MLSVSVRFEIEINEYRASPRTVAIGHPPTDLHLRSYFQLVPLPTPGRAGPGQAEVAARDATHAVTVTHPNVGRARRKTTSYSLRTAAREVTQ